MAEIKHDPIMDAQQTSLVRNLDKIANIKAGKMVESQVLYKAIDKLKAQNQFLKNELQQAEDCEALYQTEISNLKDLNKELYEALKQLYFVTYEPNFSKIETFIKARKTLKDYEAKDGK
jgi:FtsZ-binding cell division protein ZapB